jgi:hypothetical protein
MQGFKNYLRIFLSFIQNILIFEPELKINRAMNLSYQNTVAETVANDYRAAAIFEKYGIDFCCHLHIHLENNILFPKALEMEKALMPSEN